METKRRDWDRIVLGVAVEAQEREVHGFERSGTGGNQCFSGSEAEREMSKMKFNFFVKTEGKCPERKGGWNFYMALT